MTARCISCKKITLRPHIEMDMNDRKMVALGFGRCILEPRGYVWKSQNFPRNCKHVDELTLEQTEQRRPLVLQIKQRLQETEQ